MKNIAEVEDILGKEYINKNYDSEQQLREYMYKDNNNIKLEVIYSTNDNRIYWLILSELK